MRTSRIAALVIFFAIFVLALGAGWWWFTNRPGLHVGTTIDIYYAKTDGTTMVPWRVTLSPTANDTKSAAFYAATSVLAGPPPATDAIRFPAGTRLLGLTVNGKTAVVNLSSEVSSSAAGGFAESAEFKALVWTMTQPELGFTAVQVHVNGATVATLPGGHLELDEPLARSSF